MLKENYIIKIFLKYYILELKIRDYAETIYEYNVFILKKRVVWK